MFSKSLSLEQTNSLIIERCRLLVDELIRQRGHERPPFSPEEIAGLVGINRIERADIGKIGAVLLRCTDGYIMKINKNHPPVRQAFSCAHEIGHVLLDQLNINIKKEEWEFRTFDPQGEKENYVKIKERLCDIAAKELLMPEMVFEKYLSNLGVSINSLERIANIFRVSIQATALRIAEISKEPCLILLWKPELIKKSKSLRLAWCAGPRRNLENKYRYMPIQQIAAEDSAIYKAYSGNSLVKSSKKFSHDNVKKLYPVESKGFGYDDKRYVISLALLKNVSL